ncbi:MAG: hypothetical protein MUF13_13230, partial [Akkermansiaceae bacterium]|nr:hypothetical protein [Akkermansiaceae bacterium]
MVGTDPPWCGSAGAKTTGLDRFLLDCFVLDTNNANENKPFGFNISISPEFKTCYQSDSLQAKVHAFRLCSRLSMKYFISGSLVGGGIAFAALSYGCK